MNRLVTTAIVLRRTDYGEADRILTLLTPEYGKLTLIAKGVRRVKSKLAGGIELFSVSEITFIKGRGAVGTLVSTRLIKHYSHIVSNLARTMLGYELIAWLHKATEDEPEEEYSELLREGFEALDDISIQLSLVRFWFTAQLLRLAGHMPNLRTDEEGNKLATGQTYEFDYEHMSFAISRAGEGRFTAEHIKLLRLVFAGNTPRVLRQVSGLQQLQTECEPLVLSFYRQQA
jgi:DNA repair protein RecO (recombination protein O)